MRRSEPVTSGWTYRWIQEGSRNKNPKYATAYKGPVQCTILFIRCAFYKRVTKDVVEKVRAQCTRTFFLFTFGDSRCRVLNHYRRRNFLNARQLYENFLGTNFTVQRSVYIWIYYFASRELFAVIYKRIKY